MKRSIKPLDNLYLETKTLTLLGEGEYDWSGCYTHITGSVMLHVDLDSFPNPAPEEIARLEVLLLNADLFRTRYPDETLDQLYDSLGINYEDTIAAFYDEDTCMLNEEVETYFAQHDRLVDPHDNALLVHRMEVIEEFRGQGVGRLMMEHLLDTFGMNYPLFIGKVFPLQLELDEIHQRDPAWAIKMNYAGMNQDFKQSYTKVLSFDTGVGFMQPFGNHYIALPARNRLDKFNTSE